MSSDDGGSKVEDTKDDIYGRDSGKVISVPTGLTDKEEAEAAPVDRTPEVKEVSPAPVLEKKDDAAPKVNPYILEAKLQEPPAEPLTPEEKKQKRWKNIFTSIFVVIWLVSVLNLYTYVVIYRMMLSLMQTPLFILKSFPVISLNVVVWSLVSILLLYTLQKTRTLCKKSWKLMISFPLFLGAGYASSYYATTELFRIREGLGEAPLSQPTLLYLGIIAVLFLIVISLLMYKREYFIQEGRRLGTKAIVFLSLYSLVIVGFILYFSYLVATGAIEKPYTGFSEGSKYFGERALYLTALPANLQQNSSSRMTLENGVKTSEISYIPEGEDPVTSPKWLNILESTNTEVPSGDFEKIVDVDKEYLYHRSESTDILVFFRNNHRIIMMSTLNITKEELLDIAETSY